MSYIEKRPVMLSILFMILGVLLVYSGVYAFYSNNKTDALDGRGSIVASKDCEPVNPLKNLYSCTGDFRQSVADYHFTTATVLTTGNYNANDLIGDVYRDTTVTSDKAEDQIYISGTEKRSVIYNIPNLTRIVTGMVILSVAATILVQHFLHRTKRA